MAHSLRSKSKLKSKKVKTSNPNSDYFQTTQARTERLAEKLRENTIKQQEQKPSSTMDTTNDSIQDLTKVKTHGWRKSRASAYKKKKVSKKNKSLKF